MFNDCNGLRTWLGTPILFTEGSRQFLYGVLSFTRGREHERDTLFYGVPDYSAAERLAWMLAVGFHSQQSVRRMYDSLKAQLRSFLHSVRTPLDLLQNDRLESIRQLAQEVPGVEQMCNLAEMDLRFINAGFSAFTDFTKDDSDWLDFVPEVALVDIVQVVLHVAKRKSSLVNVRPPVITPPDCRCRIDETRLIFILHALVDNAIKAVRQSKRRGSVATKLECQNGHLKISVEDDGVGMPPAVEGRIYDEFFSGFARPSSGLGLTLLRRFVDADEGGRIQCRTKPNKGTEFVVELTANSNAAP